MKRKVISLLLLAAMTATMLAGCGKSSEGGAAADAGGDSAEVIKIGVFEPLTGENGGGGSQ